MTLKRNDPDRINMRPEHNAQDRLRFEGRTFSGPDDPFCVACTVMTSSALANAHGAPCKGQNLKDPKLRDN